MPKLTSFRGRNPHYHSLCTYGHRDRHSWGTRSFRLCLRRGSPKGAWRKLQWLTTRSRGNSPGWLHRDCRVVHTDSWSSVSCRLRMETRQIWVATPSSSLPGVSRSCGVGPITGLCTVVLDGRIGPGGGDGGCRNFAMRRKCYVVESTDTFTVCYGIEQDVIFDDGLGPRTICISGKWNICLVAVLNPTWPYLTQHHPRSP